MTTIKLKNGSGAPLAGDLVQGEPALDLTNKRLYTEDSGGTVIEVGTNPSTINIDAGTIDGTVIGGSTAAAGSFTTFTSTGIDDNAASTAITIDSSQNVGIGTSSPQRQLHVSKNANNTHIAIERDGTDNPSALILGANQNKTEIISSAAEESTSGVPLAFLTGNTERMRIDSSGNVLVSKTALDVGTAGLELRADGLLAATRSGSNVGVFRRLTDDGSIIDFQNSGGTTVGSIANRGTNLSVGSGDVALEFNASNDAVLPASTSTNNTRDAAVDLGMSAVRFKDLYLSGQTFGGDGAANVPSYAFGNDTNMGMYRAGNNIIGFSTSSAERMRIDGSGNVGIGSTNSGTAGSINLSVGNTSSSGGITLWSPTNSTHSLSFGDGYTGTDRYKGYVEYAHGDDSMRLATASTERMRIDASGNLGVGVTSVDAKLKVQAASGNTTFKCFNAGTGSQTYIAFNLSGGAVATGSITTNGSTTAYNTSSDYRLKENVVPLTGATERVKQLNPSRFNFIADADTTVDGFLAHEVADVVPEAITGTKDAMRDEEYEVTPAVYEDVVIPAVLDEEGNEVEAERTEQQLVSEAVMGTRSVPDYQGIDQSKLVPLLVATIQELEARITALESN